MLYCTCILPYGIMFHCVCIMLYAIKLCCICIVVLISILEFGVSE